MINNIRVRTEIVYWSLALVNVYAMRAGAQEPAPAPEPPRVYVVDFTTTGSDPHFAKLTVFTPELMRLQLLEMPMVDVVRTDVPPPCGEASNTGVSAPSQDAGVSTPSQSTSGAGSRPPGDFFQLSGSINFSSADIKVTGVLERCRNKTLEPVTSEQAVFVPGRALEQITVLTEFLVYKLEGLLPTTQVRVADIQPSGKKLDTIAAQLTEQLKLEMTQHPGFQLSDSPDTAVVIEGDLSKAGESLDANVKIHWGENVKPLITGGHADDVPAFLRSTSKSVFDMLSSEVIGERFGSKDYLETAAPDKLLEDGKQLLCIGQPRSCRSDPRAALRLLSAASRRSPDPDPNTFYFLALAQSNALQYPDAVATFKHVIEMCDAAAKPENRELAIKALNQLGDVYTRTGDKQAASASYAKSLERNPSQSYLYVSQAEILFATNPVGAIKLLLDGLGHNPKSETIRSAIGEDIPKLKPPDFQGAANLLATAKDTFPLTEEYAQMCAFAASQLLYSDPQLAVGYLSKLDGLSPEKLSASTRNWFARLQAVDSSRRKNFDAAYAFAMKAEKIVEDEKLDDQKLSKVVLSDVQVAWAKTLQNQDPERKRMLRETYARVKPLVVEGNTNFYQDFMDVNHLLDNDVESKLIFSNLLDKNNGDHFAARGILFVCGENLLDVKCAYLAARKALAKPSDDIDLQLDGVEAAVLNNDRKQGLEWLAIVEQHAEADNMTKAIAGFYRFWISYAENDPSSKQDFQHMVAALNEYNRARAALSPEMADTADKWSFGEASGVLNENKLPAATNLPENKKKDLLAIMDAFDHPKQGTTGLSLLAERM